MQTILPEMTLFPRRARVRKGLRVPMVFGALAFTVSLGAFGALNGLSLPGGNNGPELPAIVPAPVLETLEPEGSPTPVIAVGVEQPGDVRLEAALALPAETASARFPLQSAGASAKSNSVSPAVAASVKLYLPLALNNFQPPPAPPRQVEAYAGLGPFSTTDWPNTAPDWISASKISLHSLGTGDPYVMEFIRRSKPRVVKAAGDFGWLREVKEVSPYIVTIGRTYWQDESVVGSDPAAAAQAYIEANLSHYQLNPFIDYWEGWNEFIYDSPEKLSWFAQFEAARACQMWARGYRASVGGFAVGWPNTYPEMELFLPALEAAYRCGGIFHLHEYNKPLMLCGVQTNVAGLIPGAPALPVPAGPLTLRYRYWYEGYLKPRGMYDLPLVISETGIDAVPIIGCPDPGQREWRTWKDFAGWWQQNGYGVDGSNAYVNQLAWYDRELQHDPYVLGATVFTAGAPGSGGWNPFDIHDVMIPLAHYVAGRR